jgi:hypothetical protein
MCQGGIHARFSQPPARRRARAGRRHGCAADRPGGLSRRLAARGLPAALPHAHLRRLHRIPRRGSAPRGGRRPGAAPGGAARLAAARRRDNPRPRRAEEAPGRLAQGRARERVPGGRAGDRAWGGGWRVRGRRAHYAHAGAIRVSPMPKWVCHALRFVCRLHSSHHTLGTAEHTVEAAIEAWSPRLEMCKAPQQLQERMSCLYF